MLRIIGVILLSLSAWVAGKNHSQKLRRKMECEDALIALAEYIKSNISTRSAAISDICASFYDERLNVGSFYEILNRKESNSLFLAICEIGENECEGSVLCSAKELACTVGSCFCVEEALIICDRCISDMRLKLSGVRDNDIKREGVYSKLALICALSVFVLCI